MTSGETDMIFLSIREVTAPPAFRLEAQLEPALLSWESRDYSSSHCLNLICTSPSYSLLGKSLISSARED